MPESTISPVLAMGSLLVLFASSAAALGAGAPAAESLRRLLVARGQWLAFGVALLATSGSLYYSEVANFVPCLLCWYQRIAMYPLVLILLAAAVTRDARAAKYVVPLAVIGLVVSVYHYQLELFPEQATVCSVGVPCTFRHVEELGFISIPFMAGIGFISILALQVAIWRARRFEGARGG
jgi:disulfide bond formation protein DsbB